MRNTPGFFSLHPFWERCCHYREVQPLEDSANELLSIITLVSVFICECHPISLVLSFQRSGFSAFQMNEELALKISGIINNRAKRREDT